MNIIELKNGINRTLDDTSQRNITRRTLEVYGHGDWSAIMSALIEWQTKGYLKIVREPESAAENDVCVEMLSYIDQKSPWPNWP